MRCPRCRREIAEPVPVFCAACGAPLRLSDEPVPRALGSSLPLDRRGADREERAPGVPPETVTPAALVAGAAATAKPTAEPAPAGGIAAVERSHWDLGAPLPRVARPGGAAPNTMVRPPALPRPAPPPASPPPVPDADVEVDAVEIHLRRPQAWRRAVAAGVDVLPFAAGGVALGRAFVRAAAGLPAPATGLDGLLDLLARERVIVLSVAAAVALALAVYATLAHALAGATLGKRLVGLRVVGPDGAPPSLARSAARTALAGVSVGLLGLGVALAFFTRSGRSLHDLVARTWVVQAS